MNSYNLYGLPQEEVISIIFRLANIRKTDFDCLWYYYNLEKDSENPVAIIQFTWGILKGYSASLLIEYNIFDKGHSYEIPLDKVPKKQYGGCELYDIDVILEIGIELFNANFDESKYIK